MLTYSITPQGAESLYEQLYACIKRDILRGELPSRSRLPSKRGFARHLGVSTITVENAYAKLSDEGYIYSLPKKGFFVSDITVDSALRPVLRQAAGGGDTAGTPLIIEETDTPPRQGLLDLSAGHPPPSLFPFATWSRLVRRVLSQKEEQLMQPSPANGVAELRQAIARHLYEFRGLAVRPPQVVVGAGTEYLYSLIIQLLGFRHTFAVEDPGYGKISQVYRVCNVRCVPVALDAQGMSPEGLLASGATIAHISPSHHFPTGRVMSISRRYELLGWAAKEEGRYIIEDDYDAEFRLTGRPIPTLRSIDTIDRVIYLNTFTKTLSPTIRISYMVLPEGLMALFEEKLGFYACTVPNVNQYTLAAFMREGHFEGHLGRMRRYYREQRDRTLAELKKHDSLRTAEVLEADGGPYFLLRLPTDKADARLKMAAAQEKLSLSFLSDYYACRDDAPAHTLIVNYAGLSSGDLAAAFARLAPLV